MALRLAAPQPPGHDEPVEPGAHGQADGGPARGSDAGEVGQTRQAHQKPAGHIAGFGAHGRDEGAHLAPSQVEIGAVLVGSAVGKAHEEHGGQIHHNGGHNAKGYHILSSFSTIEVRLHFTTVKHKSARGLGQVAPSAKKLHFCTAQNPPKRRQTARNCTSRAVCRL